MNNSRFNSTRTHNNHTDSSVLDFVENLKDNKRAFNEFLSTMHGTITRNHRIPMYNTTLTHNR